MNSLKLLLPALVPSWQFFKTIAPSPRVQWRLCDAQVSPQMSPQMSPLWQEFRPRPQHVSVRRMFLRLLWNPDWNESLYCVSLSERLIEEPTLHSEDEIFRLIAVGIADIAPSQSLQFQLIFVTRNNQEILYRSAPRTLQDIPV